MGAYTSQGGWSGVSSMGHEPSPPPSSPMQEGTCFMSSRFCASCRQQQWSQKNLSSLSNISVALARGRGRGGGGGGAIGHPCLNSQ